MHPLVLGRDMELARLHAALATAASGHGAAVVVVGPAGIGKSSLLAATVEAARGFEVLRAAGVEAECELPFSGLHQLLRPLLPQAAGLPARQRSALASALAVDASVLEDAFGVFAAVLSLLSGAAETRSVLLVVDDAQWIDAPSLAAVVFAVQRLRDEPVVLIAAARSPGVPDSLSAAVLPELRLQPLAAVTARAVAAQHASCPFGVGVLDRIVALAGGVPLALAELAALGNEFAEQTASFGELSLSVEGLLERLFGRRVERLSAQGSVAVLVAALGDPDDVDAIVRAAAKLGVSARGWEEAEEAAIVRLNAGRIAFVHPLLRQAVMVANRPKARRAAHAALADALDTEGRPHRAAWHRAAAIIQPNEAVAAALECAADDHKRLTGHLAAARALERAARITPALTDRARRLILAGESAMRAGRTDWADALARQALAVSSEPALQSNAELLCAHVESWRGSSGEAYRRYKRVAELATDRDPELAARALGYAAAVGLVRGDSSAALATAIQARRIPAELLSEAAVVGVRESLGSVLALRGETRRARPLLSNTADWYEARADRIGAEHVAEALMWLGDYERVGALLHDVIADSRRMADVSVLVHALVVRADLGYRTGQWRLALADATESVDLARDTGQNVHLAYALAMLSVLDAVTGAEDAARKGAQRAIELAGRHGLPAVTENAGFALGALELARGHPSAAVEYLLRIAADVAITGRGEPAVVLWPADLIESLIATDRHHDARAALQTLTAQARRTGGTWAIGVVARYRGTLADDSGIDAAFGQAISCHAHNGMPFELARTRLCYGERLRRAGRRIDARVHLRDALRCFEAIGASGWAQRARRELATTGERLRRGPSADRDQLTHQELQIARCIAQGATNKEAAADLFLSPKTIETHLTRVYRKLGIRSRSELALVMNEPAAPTDPGTR